MKLTLLVIVGSVMLLSTHSFANAQTTAPKPTSQTITDTLSEGITDLKEKIASRVAQLDLVEKKGIIGTTTEVDDTQITLTDIYGQPRIIDVDEITNFASSDEEESFGISDIEVGTKISILGLYNKETQRLLARFVSVTSLPQYIVGKISEVDEDAFAITLIGQDNKSYTIDIETSTTSQEYVDEDFERSGFSDLEVDQQVFVTGFEDEDEPTRISASRILIFSAEEKPTKSVTSPTPSPEEDEE